MNNESLGKHWNTIDSSGNTKEFINYLRITAQKSFRRHIWQKSLDILNPQCGDKILDVGCGIGNDVLELASFVGKDGHIIGIDNSTAMIAECLKLTLSTAFPVTFQLGDAFNLPFENDQFDRCREERMLQHLNMAEKAITEMFRVLKPNGTAVFIEPDWGTLFLSPCNSDLFWIIHSMLHQANKNGLIGRQLPKHLIEAGFFNIQIEPVTVLFRDFDEADFIIAFQKVLNNLVETEQVTDAERTKTIAQWYEASKLGTFLSGFIMFVIGAIKPDSVNFD